MNREQYLTNRKALMDAAQKLLDEGKLEDAKAKMQEVEKLDADFENAAKEQANLNALANKVSTTGMQNATVGGVNGDVVASMGTESQEEDLYDSAEYKRAFQAHVLFRTEIPEKFLNADTTKTTDVGAVIPTTTMQKIFEKMETLGMVLPLVTTTYYKGGMSVPISSVKPVATWVAEGTGSERQKSGTGSINFAYHKLRCAVAMTYEVDNMAYPMFEKMFVKNVSEAMVKAKEKAIINGDGSGKLKGILTETAASNIDVAKGKSLTFAQINEAEGVQDDESAIWAMTKKTYFSQIVGMVDQDGQPVARTNYGLNGRPERTILGRPVVFLNKEYLASWSAAPAESSVIAFMYNFSDYIFNDGVAMKIKHYYDEEIDDTVCKAIEVCDGKSVRNDSLVTVTLKNA